MKTYYVTKEQLDLIKDLKRDSLPFFNLVNSTTSEMELLATRISDELDRPLLRYLGGDETIEFKVKKEPLYRLCRVDDDGDTVYMIINGWGTPSFSGYKDNAFTAPLEEIEKWANPAWEIEKAD